MTFRAISAHGYQVAATNLIHNPVGVAVTDDGIGTGRVVLRFWNHNEAAHEVAIYAYTKDGDRFIAALGRAMVRLEQELAAGVD